MPCRQPPDRVGVSSDKVMDYTLDIPTTRLCTEDVLKVVHKSQHDAADKGDYLGEMTDELEGDVIVEFVSRGAKNYGYRTRNGKVECKVRGFTLNHRGAAVLNFDTMKRNILYTVSDGNMAEEAEKAKETTRVNLYFEEGLL
ncbi:unnamed protein product [Porites evermanni]|uniref:Uncharacterized protein n=1 Tax=Porites evermanni TaxID=104178 RepID=A0ABN8MKI0_9CNID|nr:unnamed protein product [Porites evermanni]